MVVIHGHANFVKSLHLQHDIPKLEADVYYESGVQGGPRGLLQSITDSSLQNQLAGLRACFRDSIEAPLLVNRFTSLKASIEKDISDTTAAQEALDRGVVRAGKFVP